MIACASDDEARRNWSAALDGLKAAGPEGVANNMMHLPPALLGAIAGGLFLADTLARLIRDGREGTVTP